MRDVVAQGQETFYAPDNKTFDSSAVPNFKTPYFTTHEKTHVVKYINTPDDGNWIKSELIDKWKYRDAVDQAQETEFFLSNPPDNQDISGITVGTDSDGTTTTVAVDPNLPDISGSGNNVDPPWRLDPFQNLVDFSGGGIFVAAYEGSEDDFGNVVTVAAFYYSTDGLDWPLATNDASGRFEYGFIYMTYAQGMCVAITQYTYQVTGQGDHLVTQIGQVSYDGKKWITVVTPMPGSSSTINVSYDQTHNRWHWQWNQNNIPQNAYTTNPNPLDSSNNQTLFGDHINYQMSPSQPAAGSSFTLHNSLPSGMTAVRYNWANTSNTFEYSKTSITADIVNSGAGWPAATWVQSFVFPATGALNQTWYVKPGSAP